MAQPLPLPPPGFDDLSMEEKLDYVHSLWDRIAEHPKQVPVPDWHRRIIHERLSDHRSNPSAVTSWEDVRADLLDKLKQRSQR